MNHCPWESLPMAFGAQKNDAQFSWLGKMQGTKTARAAMMAWDAIECYIFSKIHVCQGLNSHYFHIIGDGHQPNSRGLYTHYKDSMLAVLKRQVEAIPSTIASCWIEKHQSE